MTHTVLLQHHMVVISSVSQKSAIPAPTVWTHLWSLQCDRGSRINTAPPFHSFKVPLGEVLWAPTQIIFDELPACHFLYITAPHDIPRRREGKKYGEGPTPLNGRETAEGWHASCHRCHGRASRCFVRRNLTSPGVKAAFYSAMPTWLLGMELQWHGRQKQSDVMQADAQT